MLPSVRLRGSIAEPRRAVNLAAAAACLVCAARAAAHPEYAPSTINRYVKLDLVAPDQLRLAYTVMVGAGPAAAARRAVDADGRLEPDETRALGAVALRAAQAGVRLTVDGKPVTPAFAEPVVGLAGDQVAPSPFSVDLVAEVPLGGAPPHTVGFDDQTPEPQLGEEEIRVEESPATRLLSSHRGPSGDERRTRFLFRGPRFSALEDRSITFRFGPGAHPTTRAAPPHHRRVWAAVALVLALVLAAALLARRRRG